MVIGKLFSVEFLGVYSMAFFLTDLPLAKINSVMRPVFLPYFARLREDPDRMRDHFRRFVLAVIFARYTHRVIYPWNRVILFLRWNMTSIGLSTITQSPMSR